MTLDLPQTKRTLERIIRRDANPCTTAEARRWLAMVELGIARPDDFAGWFGVNGYGPVIEGVIRDAGFHEKLGVNRELGASALSAPTGLSSPSAIEPRAASRLFEHQSHCAGGRR